MAKGDIRMRKLMKKEIILPILLAILPYLIMTFGLLEGETLITVALYLYLLFTAVVYIWNIVNAWKYKGENTAKELAFFNMLIKFAMVGCGNFYIFNLREKDDKIYVVSSSDLEWEECYKIADNLIQCLGQKESLDDSLFSV